MSFADEFKIEKLRISHPYQVDFSLCCLFQLCMVVQLKKLKGHQLILTPVVTWQKNTKVVPCWIIYRMFLYLYFLATVLYIVAWWASEHEGERHKVLIYFGVWSYILQTSVYFLGLAMAIYDLMRQKYESLREKPAFLYKYFWAAYTGALPMSLISTITFWSGIHEKDLFPMNACNSLLYIPNSILMVLDFILVCFPIRYLHFYIPDLFFIIYVLFSWIYEKAGGRGADGLKPIYAKLDWKDEFYKTFFYVMVSYFFYMLSYIIFCSFSFMKMWLRRKYILREPAE